MLIIKINCRYFYKVKEFEVKFKFNATCADDSQQSSGNSIIGTFTTLNYTKYTRVHYSYFFASIDF